MKAKRVCCGLIGVAIAAACISFSAFAQKAPRRVFFAHGATVARARGYLRGIRDESWFILRASAGQHMHVEIRGRGPTRGVLMFPSGKQDGGPGGVIYDDVIDETGDYRIRVSESSMAEAWRGSFTVTVEILPRAQTGTSQSQLLDFVDKYPSEMFRAVPALKSRLRQLLGTNYKAFFDRLQVEMPIEHKSDALIVRGCMAHQCGVEESVLVIDLTNDRLFAAIEFNKHFQYFTAGTPLSDALRRSLENQPRR